MRSMMCCQCGKFAEPPFGVMRWSLEDDPAWTEAAESDALPTRFQGIICQECCETIREDAAGAEEIEQGIRTGSICAYCDEPFDVPGGTTIQSYDHVLRRVHAECKAEIERLRGGG